MRSNNNNNNKEPVKQPQTPRKSHHKGKQILGRNWGAPMKPMDIAEMKELQDDQRFYALGAQILSGRA